MKKFNWLGLWFVIGVAAVMLVGFATIGNCTSITFENCDPGTWIGGVRWLDDKTDYEDVPEIELKQPGSLVIDLPEGDYAITHYRPRRTFYTNDSIVISPPAILEFKEISVGILPLTYSFGCEE